MLGVFMPDDRRQPQRRHARSPTGPASRRRAYTMTTRSSASAAACSIRWRAAASSRARPTASTPTAGSCVAPENVKTLTDTSAEAWKAMEAD